MRKLIEQPSPFEIEESYQLVDVPFDINNALIIKALSGSHAYGMAKPDSDIDIRGVFVAPFENKLQLNREIKVIKSIEGQGDVVYHELQTFCRMAAKMDSNAIQLLFTPQTALINLDEYGKALISSRDAFLNSRVRYSFGGFSFGNTTQAINPKSTSHPELREKYGLDTKMAMNAVRLCRLGTELLLTGNLTMLRPDADELLDIKNGKYGPEEFAVVEKRIRDDGKMYDEIIGGFMKDEYQQLLEAAEKSILPKEPDVQRINRIIQRITLSKLNLEKEQISTAQNSR